MELTLQCHCRMCVRTWPLTNWNIYSTSPVEIYPANCQTELHLSPFLWCQQLEEPSKRPFSYENPTDEHSISSFVSFQKSHSNKSWVEPSITLMICITRNFIKHKIPLDLFCIYSSILHVICLTMHPTSTEVIYFFLGGADVDKWGEKLWYTKKREPPMQVQREVSKPLGCLYIFLLEWNLSVHPIYKRNYLFRVI